jgi:hypothetical protein
MATSSLHCSTVCLSIHTKSLFEVGHRDTGTQLESVVLYVFAFILNLYSRWDTGTQLESVVLYVFPFLLNLYLRWDTGTQGLNLN